MSGMLKFEFVTVTILALSTAFAMYMRKHADAADNPFHRIWQSILYAYLKAAIGIGYGMEALEHGKHEAQRDGCTGFEMPTARMTEIHRKEARLAGMKRNREEKRQQKASYNMKILK